MELKPSLGPHHRDIAVCHFFMPGNLDFPRSIPVHVLKFPDTPLGSVRGRLRIVRAAGYSRRMAAGGYMGQRIGSLPGQVVRFTRWFMRTGSQPIGSCYACSDSRHSSAHSGRSQRYVFSHGNALHAAGRFHLQLLPAPVQDQRYRSGRLIQNGPEPTPDIVCHAVPRDLLALNAPRAMLKKIETDGHNADLSQFLQIRRQGFLATTESRQPYYQPADLRLELWFTPEQWNSLYRFLEDLHGDLPVRS